MTAFQALEIAALLTKYAEEIERVKFYGELSDLLQGDCYFTVDLDEDCSDRIIIEFTCKLGTYSVEKTQEAVGEWHGSDCIVITPDGENYDREYAIEKTTDLIGVAETHLQQIHDLQAAQENILAPYWEDNKHFS